MPEHNPNLSIFCRYPKLNFALLEYNIINESIDILMQLIKLGVVNASPGDREKSWRVKRLVCRPGGRVEGIGCDARQRGRTRWLFQRPELRLGRARWLDGRYVTLNPPARTAGANVTI
jgi:hypothetical protein